MPSSTVSLRLVGRTEFGRTGVPGATAFGRPDMDAFFDRRDGVIGTTLEHQISDRWQQRITFIFGDIMGDAHRAWDEGVCAVHGLTAVLPLWGESTRTLVEEFIATGSTAVIVTARCAYLDATWLGRSITLEAVEALERRGVDPCGEFGEYHSLVTSTPIFNSPLEVAFGAREMHSDCWALDVIVTPPSYVGAGFSRPDANNNAPG